MMRIIAGKHRSRKLLTPQTEAIRPTSDRVREALFSILQHRLGTFEDARVCDAFCGSGALGLEALSRGAGRIYHLDTNKAALDLVRKNIATLGEGNACTVLQADATKPPKAPQACHLLLLDPPYHKGLAEKALAALTAQGWAAPAALAAIEVAREEPFTAPDGWTLLQERIHAAARLIIVEKASLVTS